MTGVDYFGQMEVAIRSFKHEKRYDMLFICQTIRTIHLEHATNLTTDDAIMAIRRMIARRGPQDLVGQWN